MSVNKFTPFGVVEIREWPDSSGEDDHGRDSGGGFKKDSETSTTSASKDHIPTTSTMYKKDNELVTVHQQGDKVHVAHASYQKNLRGPGKNKGGFKLHSNEMGMSKDQAKSHLAKFGISHTFKESSMDPQDYSLEYVRERDFDTDARKKAAMSGAAMPDGSYPIENKKDLENAIQAIGRAKNPAATKAHIKTRAKALGCTDCIPDTWESWQTLEGELVCEATFSHGDSDMGKEVKLSTAIHGAVCAGKDMDCDGDDDSQQAKDMGPQHYIRAVHPKHVIYSMGGNTMAHKYEQDEEGDVHLKGKPMQVEPSYETKKAAPMDESCSESFSLAEAFNAQTNEVPVTIIKPGLSKNNRYYSPELLKRQSNIFEGAKMFCDHATDKEAMSRPEGSVKDWVASLKNVHAESDGTLKGTAVVIDPVFKQKLQALAEAGLLHTLGVSIRAAASASEGKVDGKSAKIIEDFKACRSVDFVTFAGAGGQVN